MSKIPHDARINGVLTKKSAALEFGALVLGTSMTEISPSGIFEGNIFDGCLFLGNSAPKGAGS